MSYQRQSCTDVKKDANVELKNRSGFIQARVLVVGIDLPALLVRAENDQHRGDYFFLAFDLVRHGDGNCGGA